MILCLRNLTRKVLSSIIDSSILSLFTLARRRSPSEGVRRRIKKARLSDVNLVKQNSHETCSPFEPSIRKKKIESLLVQQTWLCNISHLNQALSKQLRKCPETLSQLVMVFVTYNKFLVLKEL